ncbi:MAG: ABC transporter permease subunit [Vallitaleaceae bacterium]|nr:ABC transporter permease subunit [Vallitaleaceae bacterium]
MNIFRYEAKKSLQSFTLWAVNLGLLIFVFMAFYPTFSEDTAMLDKIMENYPEELLKAFGMDSGMSLSTVLGYFTFIFAFLQLGLAIQASNYGFHIVSVEERELTADFLLSKPISRIQILMAKLSSVVLSLVLTNIAVALCSYASIVVFGMGKDYESKHLILLLASSILFQLLFFAVGMLISLTQKKIRSVLSYSMALAFTTYILNAVRGIVGGEFLGLFSPFYYFEPGLILQKGSLSVMAYLSLPIIFICVTLSFILYQKRNIHSL